MSSSTTIQPDGSQIPQLLCPNCRAGRSQTHSPSHATTSPPKAPHSSPPKPQRLPPVHVLQTVRKTLPLNLTFTLPTAHGAFPPTKSNASATCPPTVPRTPTDFPTLRRHHLPPPHRPIPLNASAHFLANSTTPTLQTPPTPLCTSSRRPPSKPPTTRTPPDYQPPRPPLHFSPVHSPSLPPVHQPHSTTISPTGITPAPSTLSMMPPYSTILLHSLTPSPSEVSAAPARSPIAAASSASPPPTL